MAIMITTRLIADNLLLRPQQTVTVAEGLDFVLSHFEDAQLLWPRTISTLDTEGGQVPVYSKEQALSKFEVADLIDCRINAYPQYREGLLYEPNHLMIDIDYCTFPTQQDCIEALNSTLQNIKQHLGVEAQPTITTSGNGYHVHQPLDIPIPLERVTEFAGFREPSKRFLRYAERTLSNSKADPNHKPAFKSCLFRVPGTHNFKCIKTGKSATEVKILQRWNGIRVRPSREFMLGFHAHLVQSTIDDSVRQLRQAQNIMKVKTLGRSKPNHYKNDEVPETYRYIEERLLKTPIEDYRKHVRDVILIPYFVLIKGLADNPKQIYQIVMEWADKCAELRRLEPSRSDFEHKTIMRINQVIEAHSKGEAIPPKKWETLAEENPELYSRLLRS